jgi:5,10-methylenetetrahydromethanopterin reductase
MPREISLAFQTDKSAADYIALAKLVDQFEFDVISVYCDAPYHPSYGPLFLMAPHIKRARLGPAAISPFRIHPIDIAANTALLDQIAEAGVYIGIARGAWLGDYAIYEPDQPIRAIREAVEIIYNILSGELAGYNGHVYRIAEHAQAPYTVPDENVPLLIGTWGPKLAALAGEIADEVKVGGSANPDIAPLIHEYINQGECSAKRDPGVVGLVMGSVTVVDDDRDLARLAAKQALALYLPIVASLDPTVSLDPDLLKRIRMHVEAGDRDRAGRLISDELLELFAFAGDTSDLIRQGERLFAAGVDRIEFGAPQGLTPETGIRLIGEGVLPVLKETG